MRKSLIACNQNVKARPFGSVKQVAIPYPDPSHKPNCERFEIG
jgi:hypothetical protein